MSLTPGTKLATYEILEPIGAGGMGEVYRARDEKLKREVALKVLPEAFASDAQRMARFEREAQLLASLNHPNIGAIYGLEEADSLRFLVLELIPGDTLAERLRRGPIPFAEALELAGQIADALAAAHDNGRSTNQRTAGPPKKGPAANMFFSDNILVPQSMRGRRPVWCLDLFPHYKSPAIPQNQLGSTNIRLTA